MLRKQMVHRGLLLWSAAILSATAATHAQVPIGNLTGIVAVPQRAVGDRILTGEAIQTGADGRLMVSLEQVRAVLCIGPQSTVTLSATDTGVKTDINPGLARLYYSALKPGQTLTLATPLGTMTVTGSVIWGMHNSTAGETVFATEDTDATVTPIGGGPIRLSSKQKIRLRAGEVGAPEPLTADNIKGWEGQLQLSALAISSITTESAARIEQGIRTVSFEEQSAEAAREVIREASAAEERGRGQRIIDTPGLNQINPGALVSAVAPSPGSNLVIPGPNLSGTQLQPIGGAGVPNPNPAGPAFLLGVNELNPVAFFALDTPAPLAKSAGPLAKSTGTSGLLNQGGKDRSISGGLLAGLFGRGRSSQAMTTSSSKYAGSAGLVRVRH